MPISQTGYSKDIQGSYITKDPAASLTYSVDWSDWLPGSDTLSTSTFAQESIHTTANLTVGTAATVTGVTSSTISGGAEGQVYTVVNTVTTTNGLTDARRFKIRVEKRYT